MTIFIVAAATIRVFHFDIFFLDSGNLRHIALKIKRLSYILLLYRSAVLLCSVQ